MHINVDEPEIKSLTYENIFLATISYRVKGGKKWSCNLRPFTKMTLNQQMLGSELLHFCNCHVISDQTGCSQC